MKPGVLPKRRNSGGVTIALFPFLAVLVCAMGALIVILVLVTRQARLQACEVAASKVAQQETELRQEQEGIRWRIEQLKSSRQATEAQLAELRLQLGHLEDHSRRLRQRLTELQAARDDLQRGGSSATQQRVQMEAQIERVKQAILAAEKGRAAAEATAAQRNRSYAIVPFVGVNGTRRRPIYIECLPNAVILQPERIRLTVADFEGPLGPGNPLASALRAVREYWVLHDGFDPEKSGEPYPLLLVRPEGIKAYYAAREALKSWGSDQGYELVGEDWNISYPTAPDRELAEVVEESLRSARQRQQELIAAAPRAYGSSSRRRYRAAPGGGVMPDGDLIEPEERGSGKRSGTGEAGFGASPSSGGAVGTGEYARLGAYPDAGSTANAGSAAAGADSSLAAGATAGAPSATSPAAAASGTAEAGRAHQQDWALSGTPREQAEMLPGQATAQAAPKPGLWEPAPPPAPPERDKDKNKDKDRFQPDRGQPEFAATAPVGRKLADARGVDWGLRNAARGAVAITRPIQVECYADRLVLVPEPGVRGGRNVPLGSRTADSIDAFVSGVWEFMDGWGIAGRGMYWKPVLKVAVAPDAEPRFQDLQRLLEGSGLDIVRR